MNYSTYITLLSWETRNWRHQKRALVWCKDYGLKPLNKYVFVGEIYQKEKLEIERKFKTLFQGRTEKFFFVTLCKSCLNESMKGTSGEKKFNYVNHFELVQMTENSVK